MSLAYDVLGFLYECDVTAMVRVYRKYNHTISATSADVKQVAMCRAVKMGIALVVEHRSCIDSNRP